jgi:hypothetical protein
MTAHKNLKQRVRARMAKTGESYATARRHVVGQLGQPAPVGGVLAHYPGNVPATTALRVLLARAGIRASHTGEPYGEALLFAIAGGVGVGVFSFLYEKEGSARFYLAGRHLWEDDVAYIDRACARLGARTRVWEAAGEKKAAAQLEEALRRGPVIAWVDAAQLPNRAMPASWAGMAYHVVTVYEVAGGDVVIGDLTDEPIPVLADRFAAARSRIKKFKNRLLGLEAPPAAPPADDPIRAGLAACHQGLVGHRTANFRLDALRVWGQRLHGGRDAESWERVFIPGRRLWRGLVSVYDFIEHYGTGGGLCRPLFADALEEAAAATRDPELRALAARHADLGRAWSELAAAALPDDVPALRAARELHAAKAELLASGAPPAEVADVWARIQRLEDEADERFPLADADAAALRLDLQRRVLALHGAEVAAHHALGERIAQPR